LLSGAKPADPKPPQAGVAKPKVLVVEDDALIRMNVIEMVEQLGYPVVEAANAARALAAIDQDSSIGILFTDLGLPDMRGDALAVEASRRRRQLRIVLASGYSEHVPAAGASGATARILAKPFDLEQLRVALEHSVVTPVTEP
jgi:CheY-like chemotaxis protein